MTPDRQHEERPARPARPKGAEAGKVAEKKVVVPLDALFALVRPAVEGQGYELVDLEWKREMGQWIFRVYIDRKPGEGFISHEDCVSVSREVSALLDVHDSLPGHYSLEVSSPGVDRPLKKGADFARFVGQRAKIRLKEGAGLPMPPLPDGTVKPRRNLTGTITLVDGETVRITLDDKSLEAVTLNVADMEKANLIYQF